jgi:uncharacterized membrane protein YkvA (DUF1232 family)
VAVVAYALSPIDLFPDFIPVLGYVDDLLIIPAGLWLFRKFVADEVFEEHRTRADRSLAAGGRGAWVAAIVIVLVWLALLALVVLAIFT